MYAGEPHIVLSLPPREIAAASPSQSLRSMAGRRARKASRPRAMRSSYLVYAVYRCCSGTYVHELSMHEPNAFH